MNVDVKLCKNCKFVRPTAWWEFMFLFNRFEFAKCINPLFMRNGDYLVDGIRRFWYCATMRLTKCGTEGKFWEAK